MLANLFKVVGKGRMDGWTDRQSVVCYSPIKPHFLRMQGLEKKSEQSFLLRSSLLTPSTSAQVRMGFQGRESSSHWGGRNHQHWAPSNFKGSNPGLGPRSEAGGGPQWGLRRRRAEISALEAAQGQPWGSFSLGRLMLACLLLG